MWTLTPNVDKLIDFDPTDFNYGGSGRRRRRSIRKARTRKVRRKITKTRMRRNKKSRSRK